MSDEVLFRKLLFMRQLLRDLEPYANATLEEVQDEHYKLERLLELLVAAAIDILFHLLAERQITPTSYRESFRLAGEQGLLPVELAGRLELAAGMRNVLVHLYDDIDYVVLHHAIPLSLQDFHHFVEIFSKSP